MFIYLQTKFIKIGQTNNLNKHLKYNHRIMGENSQADQILIKQLQKRTYEKIFLIFFNSY